IGMSRSSTNEVTILPNVAPIMTPTARSKTFPLLINSLNSFNIVQPSCGNRKLMVLAVTALAKRLSNGNAGRIVSGNQATVKQRPATLIKSHQTAAPLQQNCIAPDAVQLGNTLTSPNFSKAVSQVQPD